MSSGLSISLGQRSIRSPLRRFCSVLLLCRQINSVGLFFFTFTKLSRSFYINKHNVSVGDRATLVTSPLTRPFNESTRFLLFTPSSLELPFGFLKQTPPNPPPSYMWIEQERQIPKNVSLSLAFLFFLYQTNQTTILSLSAVPFFEPRLCVAPACACLERTHAGWFSR